jgi:aspartyl-tRNA(Asn)/glutamyl-tRNA(Gln) amidotransferase subunit C
MSTKQITTQDIKKIASLSKLQLSDEDTLKFSIEFSEIIGFVDKLQELDLAEVEPLEQVIGGHSYLRQDQPKVQLGAKEMLKNAPDQAQNLVRVPKVIG